MCGDELVPAYQDEDAWTGVRVYDQVSADRLDELPVLRSSTPSAASTCGW